MTDQSAFSQDSQPQETPAQQPSQQSAFADLLGKIKNEKGEQKYNSVDTALDALAHSQSYIPQLKTELETKEAEIRRLQEELNKRAAVEDVVEKLTAKQTQPESTPQVSGLSEQDVLNLVQNFTVEQQQKQSAAQNEKQVSDALFSKFGEKTKEVISTKAAELGMTIEALKKLSQTSPQAALQLFGTTAKATSPKTVTGSINIPPVAVKEEGLGKPTKSMLVGASTREQVEYLQKIKQEVFNRHGIEN